MTQPLEQYSDFLHFINSDNGANFNRNHYFKIFQDVVFALGNPTSYNPESPYLPIGVPPGELLKTTMGDEIRESPSSKTSQSRLKTLAVTGFQALRKRAMTRSLTLIHTTMIFTGSITLLGQKGDTLFEGSEGDVGLGLRERFPDVVRGSDRDDLNTISVALERVACRAGEPGEPYQDTGLDGVPLTPQLDEGGFDWGESNGVFDYNPHTVSFIANTTSLWLAKVMSDADGGPRFWIDGGIRDALNFAVAGMYLAGRLNDQSLKPVVSYEGFESLLGRDPFVPLASDQSRFELAGDHVFLRYGDPDATPAEIADGDGAHVGTETDAIIRISLVLQWIMLNWMKTLGTDAPRGGSSPGRVEPTCVDSESFGGRYHFSVALPPGYDDPGHSEVRYPVIYLLHGYGQRVRNFTDTSTILNVMMINGLWPATIIVYPDGSCSSMTVFACNDGVDNDLDGRIDLADPDCRDRERRNTERDEDNPSRCQDQIDNDRDGLIDLADPGCLNTDHNNEGERREGTFYLPHAVAKYGVSQGRDYERALPDMMDFVESQYRVIR